MAYRIARADGDWTAAGTWGEVDSTSLLDAQNANTALTTSFTTTATFAPGAIEIDGIAVKVATRAATPSGTMTVRLAVSGSEVAGTTVTINVSDLPYSTLSAFNDYRGCSLGWVFFKFAAPVTLMAATNYTLQASTSVSTQVNLFRNATANNWARMLRTTTTGAPGAGDSLFIVGEWTAAATKTDRAVVMDETASTDYGSEDLILASLGIGKGGALSWGITASTDYLLVLSGILQVWVDGIYRQGTAAAPVPADSTAVLQFDPASDGQFGWYSLGEFTVAGSPRTAGIEESWCLLNTDEAAGQTTLGVDRETGWLSGDDIAIASTTRTPTQAEARTLDGNATATEIAITSGLTNAHDGTAPVQAEVILLTRNVRIVSASSTAMAFGIAGSGTVTMSWAETRYFGANVSGKFAHIRVPSDGDPVISTTRCAFRDGEHTAVLFDSGGLCEAFTDHGSVFYAQNTFGIDVGQSADLALSLTDTVLVASNLILSSSSQLAWSGVRVASANVSMVGTSAGAINGLVTDLVQHSSGSSGLGLHLVKDLTFVGGSVYRNNNSGLNLSTQGVFRITFNGMQLFGNLSRNIAWNGGSELRFLNCTSAGDTTFATTTGLDKLNAMASDIYFGNCNFSPTEGIFVPHTTDLNANTPGFYTITLVDTLLQGGTQIGSGLTGDSAYGGSSIRQQRSGGVTGEDSTFYPGGGTVAREASVYRTAAPSEVLSPVAYVSLRSGIKRRTVRSGNRLTFAVYVRKDGTFDGTARLMLRANAAIGLDEDVELAAFSGAADTWVQLSGAMPDAAEEDGVVEAYVEVTGSAGNIYTDDWSAAEA